MTAFGVAVVLVLVVAVAVVLTVAPYVDKQVQAVARARRGGVIGPSAGRRVERVLAEVAEALQPTGPLMAACAPAWTALRLTAVQFFTLVVSGEVGLSALGFIIP